MSRGDPLKFVITNNFSSRQSRAGGSNVEIDSQHRQAVDPGEVKQLRTLAKGNTPTRVIGLKLGRTSAGVSSKSSQKRISLKPTNQSPYNRRQG